MTRSLRVATLALLLGGWALSSPALAHPRSKLVGYRGARVVVPASWPVYDLARAPSTCVRFDRHAVYLGIPGAAQRCPAHAVGRTEAILISPLVAAVAAGGSAHGIAPALPTRSGRVLVRRLAGAIVTATWRGSPGVIASAIGAGRVSARPARASGARLRVWRAARRDASASAPAHAAAAFAGLGFDVCQNPSSSALAAWSASPYRAVGMYIGGTNMACSQPNLTASWVSSVTAAGWHLIPTYVGLQAPGNSCGCASISPKRAGSEGTAAADDAIAQAQAVGIGSDNPIYFDMEAYARTKSDTQAALAFLAAWTSTLHAAGYQSGVYSSAASGISDLAAAYGTGYLEPDDIWIADWNGVQTTTDPYVPAADWAFHQRLHQYSGGHNVTYGGVTFDIDGDALDGATVGSGSIVPDGTFVQDEITPTIYRVAGGAPLLVSNWAAVGGQQPVTFLTDAQFNALNPFPVDRTFLVTSTGRIFRVAGGAPIEVSNWSVFGGVRPSVAIDEWDIDNITDPAAHLRAAPADCTVVEGFPSRTYWVFTGGARSPTVPTPGAVGVDDFGLQAFPQQGAAVVNCAPVPAVAVVGCVVPRLLHDTISQATRVLRAAHCRLGKVRRPRHVRRHHVLRIVAQNPAAGAKHSLRYKVAVSVR